MEGSQEGEEDPVRAKASLDSQTEASDSPVKESRPRSRKHHHPKQKSAGEAGSSAKRERKHKNKDGTGDELKDGSLQQNGSLPDADEDNLAKEQEDTDKEKPLAGEDTEASVPAEGQLLLPESKTSIFIEDRWAALKEARAFRNENQPRMLVGDGEKVVRSKKYSLFIPIFSDEHPTLAELVPDLGPGIAIYFDTLLSLSLLLFAMFILNSTSLVVRTSPCFLHLLSSALHVRSGIDSLNSWHSLQLLPRTSSRQTREIPTRSSG
eukprot:764866-Hanusia_phi.AAC.3